MRLDHRGTTALITGASSGLGEEFARQLAARGANLILVARRTTRLESLAAELRNRVEVTVVTADLAVPGAAADLAAHIRNLGVEVDTLINNAGFATRNRFEREDPERIHDEMALNVVTLVELTRAFYPEMLRAGRGVLINLSSTGSYQPVPLMAVYGATKAFVLSFTEALWWEARDSGLRVLSLSPGATKTEFFEVAGPEAQIGGFQEPRQVVRLALDTLDRRNPPPSVISGASNRFGAFLARIISRRASVGVTGRLSERESSVGSTPTRVPQP